MIVRRRGQLSLALLAGASAIAIASAVPAAAEDAARSFDIPAQPLSSALLAYSRQTDTPVIASMDLLEGKTAPAIHGDMPQGQALAMLLQGTGLRAERGPTGSIVVERIAADPQSGSAAGDGADSGTVQALIVTAQKREENIQDVPIAMSAFTQEDLTRSQVATGADLMTQVPNMTFTKTNFTSYSIQLRGIGTQAISATVDPAVAVAFNNTPFLRAHFFEQEFYDMERVEVLRGPQGTLYGRNATAGVVNLISAKPKFHFEAKASADISNYSSHRLEGMVNLPLVEDKVALRLAGEGTKRDGYSTNQITGNPIDGRDLWSTRVSLRLDPTGRLSTNFIWEHFKEDDDRLRSGKQTCHRASTPATVDGVSTDILGNGVLSPARYLDQGCLPVSIYSPEAFETPHGLTLPYYLPLAEIGGFTDGNSQYDIYASTTQSRDVRVVESQVDPSYQAKSDTVELNIDYKLNDALTLTSQTGYAKDFIFSTQDYNRFNTRRGAFKYCDPADPGCALSNPWGAIIPGTGNPVFTGGPAEQIDQPCDLSEAFCEVPAVFCDPQIGCSDRLVVMDLATARSRQVSQEFRVASKFDGRVNFSLGANYLQYKTLEDYYVFINTATVSMAGMAGHSLAGEPGPWVPGVSDNSNCLPHGFDYVDPRIPSLPRQSLCGYIDPNPITALNGQGHNYFRNQNPYKIQSYAVFGEAYYQVTDTLKLTAGLRWTIDKKRFESIPSQLLVAGYGYPTIAEIKQEWREPTGRLVLNWSPDVGFTDDSMFYASFTHGYKAGGANPPGAVLLVDGGRGGNQQSFPVHPATFEPEFLNAYEVGTKNALLDGRLTVNLATFYYDYTGYQISEIVDRSAINLNFDAKIWGVEFEADWRPTENLRLGTKVGYEDTALADGSKAVDLMDRTTGKPGWIVVKPFPTQASNCVLPTQVIGYLLQNNPDAVSTACGSAYLDGDLAVPGFDPSSAPNGGAGFNKDLSGNALPNAPRWTATLTADYTVPLPSDWLMTVHTDLYRQSEAWTRVFNMPGYDKLKAYANVNLAAIFTNEAAGWTVMAYVKNVFDKDNITGAFLNSDDTGLTTNIFVNEPRLFGVRATKSWSAQGRWRSHAHTAGAAYPFTIELEGAHGGIGGGRETFMPGLRLTATHENLSPPDLRFPSQIQSDLAASNGGGIRFTYKPEVANGWSLSGGVRYGRAGGGTGAFKKKDVGKFCIAKYSIQCSYPSGPPAPDGFPARYGWHSYFETTATSEESHAFADFTVGKDLGLGKWGARSTVMFGLGYGRLQSTGSSTMHGTPDLYFPANLLNPNFTLNLSHFHRFNDTLRSDSEFEGAGPDVDWEAAVPLMRNDASGRVDIDVGLGGTILFGKQQAEVRGHLHGDYAQGLGPVAPFKYGITALYDAPIHHSRSASATVPGVRANLGLSYSTGGLKLSGGYRWERYYNAIDGGIEERKTYDRSFDGPYMKVSVGFGG